MAKKRRRRKGQVPAAFRAQWAKNRKKKSAGTRSRRRRRRSVSERRFTPARTGGSIMARRRRSRRGSSKRRGGFLTGARGRGGFLSGETLAVVGGAVASGFLAPMLSRFLPAQLRSSPVMTAVGALAIGAVGYIALKRVNKSAALGFAAATIAPAIMAFVQPRRPATGVSGWYDDLSGPGDPDGIEYMPALAGMDDATVGYIPEDTGVGGLGEYDPVGLTYVN